MDGNSRQKSAFVGQDRQVTVFYMALRNFAPLNKQRIHLHLQL